MGGIVRYLGVSMGISTGMLINEKEEEEKEGEGGIGMVWDGIDGFWFW